MHLENEKNVITVVNSDITGSSFKNVRAEQVSIECANLTGITLNDVNLTSMTISDANLSDLAIDGAQWGGAQFKNIGFADKDQPEPELQERNPLQFTHCSLREGIFTNCDLSNVKLENCNISGLMINGMKIEELIKQHTSSK
ncbi:pentapeptide repeat-containing protein [Cohnella lupini]|uniref:Pentapeptide repeat protein n=1 Tax=Cohnella lupini TaxID=1294267 RepID=A0A3D9IXH8_9BACL|nr:pentapeptide repeat-containing protein [Cohnella lupini]RED66317.1 pentapeptide repeat protein [Cohnella lupini]